jgi:hypothetical protein
VSSRFQKSAAGQAARLLSSLFSVSPGVFCKKQVDFLSPEGVEQRLIRTQDM